MTKFSSLIVVLCAAILINVIPLRAAQPVQSLPVGTLLPVMLNNTLDSDKSKPGEKISAKLKQDVSLPDGSVVKAGTEITGHIVTVKRGGNGLNGKVVLVFDHIRMNRKDYAVTTGLRALASMTEIFQARQPINSVAMDGSSTWDYNTRQIGGDIVFGRKDVRSNDGVVGMSPEPGWVVGVPRGNPEAGCPAPDNKNLQAFWLFSTSACGVYPEEEDLQISRTPADNKDGEVTLTSSKRVLVRGGAGLLLTVLPQSAVQSVQ
jgi:hypothetical protein